MQLFCIKIERGLKKSSTFAPQNQLIYQSQIEEKMKKFKFMAALCIAALSFVSCDPATPDDPTPNPDSTESIALTQAMYFYYGADLADFGITYNDIDAYFATDGITFDLESGAITGTGTYLNLGYVFTNDTTISAGTYTLDTISMAANTFLSASIVTYAESVVTVAYEAVSGTVVVTDDSIKFSFTLENDSVITAYYTGTPAYYDYAEEEGTDDAFSYEPTTVTTLNETYTTAQATNYGDMGTGSDLLDLVMENDATFSELYVFLPTGTGTTLPAGTYNIADTYAVNTVLASAGWDSDYEYDVPSFLGVYTGTDGYYNDTYYFVSGSLTVAVADDVYTITLAAMSYYGSTINATYTGALTVEDGPTSAVAPAAAPSVKNFNIRNMGLRKTGKKVSFGTIKNISK